MRLVSLHFPIHEEIRTQILTIYTMVIISSLNSDLYLSTLLLAVSKGLILIFVLTAGTDEICDHCGQKFGSTNTLRHHQMFSCLHAAAHFAKLDRHRAGFHSDKDGKDGSASEDADSDEYSDNFDRDSAMMNWASESAAAAVVIHASSLIVNKTYQQRG